MIINDDRPSLAFYGLLRSFFPSYLCGISCRTSPYTSLPPSRPPEKETTRQTDFAKLWRAVTTTYVHSPSPPSPLSRIIFNSRRITERFRPFEHGLKQGYLSSAFPLRPPRSFLSARFVEQIFFLRFFPFLVDRRSIDRDERNKEKKMEKRVRRGKKNSSDVSNGAILEYVDQWFLTLSERMPPYSRHHKYSKRIECRHRGGKKKNSRLLLELKLKYCRCLKITTQKLPNFIRIATQILPFS